MERSYTLDKKIRNFLRRFLEGVFGESIDIKEVKIRLTDNSPISISEDFEPSLFIFDIRAVTKIDKLEIVLWKGKANYNDLAVELLNYSIFLYLKEKGILDVCLKCKGFEDHLRRYDILPSNYTLRDLLSSVIEAYRKNEIKIDEENLKKVKEITRRLTEEIRNHIIIYFREISETLARILRKKKVLEDLYR